jgi:hypothetical protein
MTDEEIDNLPAGDEINVLVATKIMGWTNVSDRHGYQNLSTTSWSSWLRKIGRHPDGFDLDVPDYSGGQISARNLLMHMRDKYGFAGKNNYLLQCNGTTWYCEFPNPSWSCAEASTPELAICKAALKAVLDASGTR